MQNVNKTKSVPEGASQHVTAGPYSPVIIVEGSRLVLISGQAPLNKAGEVIGDTIEEQTRVTLQNCEEQLKTAGASFDDVFKVNVYLTDLAEWPRFNSVYSELMPEPRPARTAVQTGLLSTFKVEIEMWAMLP
ncbi:RidA family protein [Rhodobacteraceae bacterium RKSG542]|uniref:RidA family protein n=1 Tax=Pseudovibrio flavus TaxID=2529854 RepID=UPI0012BB5617|nr:RidA family protein [Pseudovibrio flavus]MTI18204.1 RidA family protein [Pseudovibrio flavus]